MTFPQNPGRWDTLNSVNVPRIPDVGWLTTPLRQARIEADDPLFYPVRNRRMAKRRMTSKDQWMAAVVMSVLGLCAMGLCASSAQVLAGVRGDYLESRTCDVYTGPCFANGEVGISGREAVLAWRLESGSWEGVDVAGLGVVAILKANDTLGFGGLFLTNPTVCEAVVVTDERGTPEQRRALVLMVSRMVAGMGVKIVAEDSAPIQLALDHLSGRAELTCGKEISLRTRRIQRGDCVCSNEVAFYPPLVEVENERAVYTERLEATARALKISWRTVGRRSSYIASFARDE